ncbi:DUF1206 domain-containing protein [Pseudonocardia xishanensis]|uniref:DUF1206 domain-containing protein n=1 Tax=Pseudonocardia xishanensis TaxID=630995 RepID=A0ABP8RJ07_9PSEU
MSTPRPTSSPSDREHGIGATAKQAVRSAEDALPDSMPDLGGAHRKAARAGRSEPVRKGARVGIAANGVLHLLIAGLALQVAFGGGGQADQSGALTTLAAQPFGIVLLWLLFVGFVCVVLWRLTSALFGFSYVDDGRKKLMKRVVSAGLGVVYAVLAVATATTAVNGRAQGGGGSKATAGILGIPGGQVIVGIIGVGIVVGGGVMVYNGWKKKFTEDQDLVGADRRARRLDERSGQVGYIAKGIAIGVLGVLVISAAVKYDPAEANGLDSALKALAAQPFGVVLLTVVALGIAAYGVFCFLDAKYHRV